MGVADESLSEVSVVDEVQVLLHLGQVVGDEAERLADLVGQDLVDHGAEVGLAEPEHVERSAQRVPQVSHPRGRDLCRTGLTGGFQPKIELKLILGQPLPRSGLERLQFGLIVG